MHRASAGPPALLSHSTGLLVARKWERNERSRHHWRLLSYLAPEVGRGAFWQVSVSEGFSQHLRNRLTHFSTQFLVQNRGAKPFPGAREASKANSERPAPRRRPRSTTVAAGGNIGK